jgi:predicted nucleic acid-binding protein
MIAIDTNILIWGLDRRATAGIEGMVPLAERFFEYAARERIEVIVPTQVLAEFLVRNTEDERQAAIALIDPSFPLAPLDFPAALIAAELTSNRNHTEEVRATFGLTRQVVKADVNIIASALNFGATKLISGNFQEMRALAQGRIIVQSLPDFVASVIDRPEQPIPQQGEQTRLFGDVPAELPEPGPLPARQPSE